MLNKPCFSPHNDAGSGPRVDRPLLEKVEKNSKEYLIGQLIKEIDSNFPSAEKVEFLLNSINSAFILNTAGIGFRAVPLLCVATNYGYTRIVNLLLEHGLNPNVTDVNGRTPLHYAVVFNYSLEIMENLVTAGADINIKDHNGYTPSDLIGQNPEEKQFPKMKRFFDNIKTTQKAQQIGEGYFSI